MASSQFNIEEFALRLRQLISQNQNLKKENADILFVVKDKDEEILILKNKIKELEEKYNALLTAKMLNITDDNIEDSKKRVNHLIRTVNQCITLLSEK